jgi:hypothetical protein
MSLLGILRRHGLSLLDPTIEIEKPVTTTGDVTVGDDLTVTDDAAVGGDLAVTGNAAVTGNVSAANLSKTVKVALAALDTAGGVLSWANPEGAAIIITGIVLDVTTKATGACTIDVGYAANGTTSADSIMDGLDVGTSIGTFNNVDNKGDNGLGSHSTKMSSTQFITASKASGAAAGLVGNAYITYRKA